MPADAAAGTQRITMTGTSGGASSTLDLDIRVTQSAAGNVTLTTQFPQLKGVSSTNFSFSLNLTNDTADDLHVRRGRHRTGRLDGHRRGRLPGPGRHRRGQGRSVLDHQR